MRILSVNIGDSRPVTVKNRTIQTGIYKTSRSGPVKVSRLGLEGDVRIEVRKMGLEHSAVYAYPFEHYAYWQQELERDTPFPIGKFGENLTVTGLLEEEVRIGDIFRFGNTVLQVAHPRIPCGKLNARMGFRFASMFLASCKVGYYMRVLTEGTVEEGDSIELLERDENSPTMEEFVRVTHYEYWNTEALQNLLQARDLMPAWRETIEDKLERSQSASGWLGLREFEVVQREDENDNTVSLYLKCAKNKALSSFRGGQQLMIVPGKRGDGSQQRKSFYLSSNPRNLETYRITVSNNSTSNSDKPECSISAYVYNLQPGEHLFCNAPYGPARPDPEDVLEQRLPVLISQASGLAPMLSLLYELEATQNQVMLFYESSSDLPQGLLNEVNQLVEQNPGFQVIQLDHIQAKHVDPHVTLRQSDIYVAGSASFIERLELEFMAFDISPAALRTHRIG